MKTTSGAELLVRIDRESPVALHLQLEMQLRAAVQTGSLAAGSPLPSTRSLAADLALSRGVVVEAYEQLGAEGYFASRSGSGTRVAAVRAAAPQPLVDESVRPWPRYDFRPGMPDLALFPRAAWLASLRRALLSASRASFGYPDPRGPLATRTALAAHLGRSRATVGQADRIVLCSGFTQGIDLVARLLQARGVRSVAIEDPGFGGLVRLFSTLGIATPRVPVDKRGLVIERLERTAATAVIVTPAHQFPCGSGMAPERRAALLAWAARRDALVVEDDYDAEFRYDREPLGALQGLAPDRVVYIGTTSKTLSPALRLGWLLAPAGLAAELASIKRRADRGSPTIEQLALADFLTSGQMDRHLRKMRSSYRLRRDALVAALREHLPRLHVEGVAAGLHLMVNLPPGTDERALIIAAREQSIRVFGAFAYRARPRRAPPALVMGYGSLHEHLIADGVQRLARLIVAAG